MLREHIFPIIKKAVKLHMNMLHKLINKMSQLNKMDNNREFIPHFDRMVNFDFWVTKKVENSPEFITVKAETNNLVLEFKLTLKRKVMETLKNDCKILRNEIYDHLAKILHLIIQAQLISD